MKKVFLSVAVIVAFFGYAFLTRRSGNSALGSVTPSTIPAGSSSSSQPLSSTSTTYKDGTYTGSPTDAFYGTVQVQAVITGGKITDVKFLNYPQDRRNSQEINSQAMPYLIQEAIQAQSANVDIISGATATSQAFQQSLYTALQQAS